MHVCLCAGPSPCTAIQAAWLLGAASSFLPFQLAFPVVAHLEPSLGSGLEAQHGQPWIWRMWGPVPLHSTVVSSVRSNGFV